MTHAVIAHRDSPEFSIPPESRPAIQPIQHIKDLIVNIFSFLEQSDISHGASACRNFANSAFAARKEKNKMTQGEFLRYLPHFLSHANPRSPSPESVLVQFNRTSLDHRLKTALAFRKQFPKIEHLDLSHCDARSRSRRLIIKWADYFFPCLLSLSIVNCTNARDGELMPLAKLYVQISILDLSNCNQLSAVTMGAVACQKRLRSLNLEGCQALSDDALCCLRNPKLQELNIAGCSATTEIALTHFGNAFHNLTSLNLAGCYKFKIEGLLDLLCGCPRLARLDLRCCTQIDDAALLEIGKLARTLISLNLAGCVQVTDKGIEKLGELCSNLTEICLKECKAELCSNLTEICLKECKAVTPAGVTQLLKTSPKLQSVRLSQPATL